MDKLPPAQRHGLTPWATSAYLKLPSSLSCTISRLDSCHCRNSTGSQLPRMTKLPFEACVRLLLSPPPESLSDTIPISIHVFASQFTLSASAKTNLVFAFFSRQTGACKGAVVLQSVQSVRNSIEGIPAAKVFLTCLHLKTIGRLFVGRKLGN